MAVTDSAGGSCPSHPAPIDLAHLSRQTLGDAALGREILALFHRQLCDVRARLRDADATERRQLAHSLIGSARGVGAFALADCAAEIEAQPMRDEALARFAALADEAAAHISALQR